MGRQKQEKPGTKAGRGQNESAVLWSRACQAAEERIASIGSPLNFSLYRTLFPEATETAPPGLLEDGVAILPSEGEEVILLADYPHPAGDGPGSFHGARVFVGRDWMVELCGRKGAEFSGRARKVSVTVSKRAPGRDGRDPLLLDERDWLKTDPPTGSLPGELVLDGHNGEAIPTRETHYSNGVRWSPRVDAAADTAYFPDGRVFWLERQANGRPVSRKGLPSLEAFWPNGNPMVTEYTDGEGLLHRERGGGPAYREWHPDGSLALEIHAERGRVTEDPDGKFGVRVGIPPGGAETISPESFPTRTGDREPTPATEVLEMRWTRKHENGRETAEGKPDVILRHSRRNPWRLKKFFSRHPESAAAFPEEAEWLRNPNCELLPQGAQAGPLRRANDKTGAGTPSALRRPQAHQGGATVNPGHPRHPSGAPKKAPGLR